MVDEHEAAAELGLAVATPRNWSRRKIESNLLKFGRTIHYRSAEIERSKRESLHDPFSVPETKGARRGTI